MKILFFTAPYKSFQFGFLVLVLFIMTAGSVLAMEPMNQPANPTPSSSPTIVNKKIPPDQPLEAILPINVNTADAKTLMRVPGINRKAAGQIVNHRDRNGKYTNLKQLVGFSGIGETTVFLLKKYLVVK